ncbi:MAG: ABC transporter ATP-binding protein, partial [bacterium]|nr:ABC transporter ATP-binding protein [bacterium]
MNWQLALLTFSTLPLLLLIATRFRGRMQRAYHEVRRKAATVSANLQESISGMRVVQSFSREDENAQKFDSTNQDNMQANMQAAQLNSAFGPLVEVVATLGICIVLWYGGLLVRNQALTVGVVFAFLRYTGRFFMPIRDLSQVYSVWQAATVSIDRIFEVLDEKPKVMDAQNAPSLPLIAGEVVFDKVSFGYKADITVLNEVSFSISPGQTVALVGPTGAGKSSVINLLARFYDPTVGSIRIDGHDLRHVTQKSLHQQIAIVLQDTFIFSGTVTDNIRYGAPGASMEEVVAAAKAVNAHDFIMKMSHGYDTQVQERGARLSVGQRQLISFARALICNPRLLVLDEATSSVDAYTEVLIQSAVEGLLKDRTSFVIAHRLSTIRKADVILVIDQGRIVERGTHESLLQLEGGLYRNLYEVQ